MLVEEKSREWARLTDELALYQANLTNIQPEEGTDYPLKFKVGESSPTKMGSGAVHFNSEDPESMGELESEGHHPYCYITVRKFSL